MNISGPSHLEAMYVHRSDSYKSFVILFLCHFIMISTMQAGSIHVRVRRDANEQVRIVGKITLNVLSFVGWSRFHSCRKYSLK